VLVTVASRELLCSVRVVRGAQTWLPAFRSKPRAAQRVSVLHSLPARDTSSSLCRTTVIDKVLGVKGNGLLVQSPIVTCAGWSSTPSSQPRAAQRALVQLRRCTGGSIIGQPLLRRRPFVQGRTGVQRVARTRRNAQPHFSQLWGLSYNKSLQRSGTHKVLARGRALTFWVGAVRPRAPTGRRAVAELSRYAARTRCQDSYLTTFAHPARAVQVET
jgi:hypothetical protein